MFPTEDELLLKLYHRQKSQRSQYVHVEAFKSYGGKSAFKKLCSRGLVTFYKGRKVVGLTSDGALYIIHLLEELQEKEKQMKEDK